MSQEVRKTIMDIGWLDLNEHVGAAGRVDVYYITVSGGSLEADGVHQGDLLIVDRNLLPKLGDLFITDDGGGVLTVKKWSFSNLRLVGDKVTPFVWGVVTFILKNLRKAVDNPSQNKVP